METETPFIINDYSYHFSQVNIRDTYSIEISDHVNFHLGIQKEEFVSLTAEEVEKLEKEGTELKKNLLKEKVPSDDNWLGLPDIKSLFSGLFDLARNLGGLVSWIIVVFIIYLLLKGRNARQAAAPDIRMGLLILVPLLPTMTMGSHANPSDDSMHQIVIKLNADQASSEIVKLQQDMQDKACNFWDLAKHYKYWLKHEGHYAITLACTLAKLNIRCPCDSSE